MTTIRVVRRQTVNGAHHLDRSLSPIGAVNVPGDVRGVTAMNLEILVSYK